MFPALSYPPPPLVVPEAGQPRAVWATSAELGLLGSRQSPALPLGRLGSRGPFPAQASVASGKTGWMERMLFGLVVWGSQVSGRT